ncbi:mitochondrial ribonuclease P protein 3 [Stegastes partitus]|uniref:Mitochondrial ribonuclease P catalytic subunit n=1 Tax=Stegastes partitus TaxID=144197 RepID=A0A3B4Z1T5_9TELE|nr:PREDICTED: mitochondrial ribonuclease P protein 3 [Stegastes partitus]
MSFTLILKVRICGKSLEPFLHRGHPAFLTLSKSPQLPTSGRFLCTRDLNQGGRQTDREKRGQTDRQGGIKSSPIRQGQGRSWGDAVGGKGKSASLRQKPFLPTSVFAAGNAKRTTDWLKRKAAMASKEKEQQEKKKELERTRNTVKVQPPARPLPAAEWKKLRESLGNPERFDIHMLEAILHLEGDLDVAKSLLTFVALETGTLPYGVLLRYLLICVHGGHDTEVFDVYEIMRKSFPSVDTGACTLFIKSFSRTERWREAIDILQEVKKIFLPTTRNYGDIISAAVQHGDMTTAWALYNELIEKGLSPQWETWDALFKGRKKTNKEEGEAMSHAEQQEKLLGILLSMRNNQIYPKHSLASTIKTWFESLAGQNWTGSWTSITQEGVCKCCGSALESIQLTDEEYQQLKHRVMSDVIQGRDVFNKTTPQELKRFEMFVKKKPAFDVVVDGLNVANMTLDRSRMAQTLLAVVTELELQGLTILVLGRKHMLNSTRSWDRKDMNLIQQKAHCFFTDDMSEDDPFLLYATLNSGNHCRFVSRDLMRDHKACFPDEATRRLFFKWQRGHQLVVYGYVTAGTRVRFQRIPSYDTIVQTAGDSWHIPYDDTEDRSTYEVPQRWLCLTKKH